VNNDTEFFHPADAIVMAFCAGAVCAVALMLWAGWIV
jgi:hypothetical protein